MPNCIFQVNTLIRVTEERYSEDNLQTMQSLKWLSRVPLTLKQAAQLVSEFSHSSFRPSDLEGYRIAEVSSNYAGIPQRWFVIESQERQRSDLQKWDKTLSKSTQHWQSQLQQLSAQVFACEPDALAAASRFQQQLLWHQLENLQVIEQRHYPHSGRPAKDAQPNNITYRSKKLRGAQIPIPAASGRGITEFALRDALPLRS